MSALPALVDMGVAEFDALVKAGRVDPGTEHVLCHYSAEHFRAKLLDRLRDAGHAPEDKRWFTNLHTAGNTGAASIFVMLDAARERIRPGDRVLLIVPDIDPEPGTRRLLNLDIQTALCLMNIPFAFCLTPAEYRRAVHSLRLDTSLLTALASLTGDDAFFRWRSALPPVRVDSHIDVPAAVYEHALICEFALARLCALRDCAPRSPAEAPGLREMTW